MREAAIEQGRIKQGERDLRREQAKERELSLVVDSRGDRQGEAERLTARQSELGLEIGVAREGHLHASLIAPGEHLTVAFGTPPKLETQRRSWERAVRAIESYRFNNQVDAPEPLGARPVGGPLLRQFQAAEQELLRGQRQLGREVGVSLELGL